MKNSKPIPTKENSNPITSGTKPDMDELARLWVEMVLRQINKAPVVFSKESSNNIIIGQ